MTEIDSSKVCTCQNKSFRREVIIEFEDGDRVAVQTCAQCGGFFWETERLLPSKHPDNLDGEPL